MAETLNVVAPAKISIKNTSEVSKRFVPYKENFTILIGAGAEYSFEVKTSGQVLYYLAQATDGLEIKTVEAFSGTKINVPAKITLTNTSDMSIGFVPYKENFQYDIEAGNSVELVTENVGQTLYYLAQATEGLEVTQDEVTE
jgi:hypothetical protein